jgi:hypothetical protein
MPRNIEAEDLDYTSHTASGREYVETEFGQKWNTVRASGMLRKEHI